MGFTALFAEDAALSPMYIFGAFVKNQIAESNILLYLSVCPCVRPYYFYNYISVKQLEIQCDTSQHIHLFRSLWLSFMFHIMPLYKL